MNEPIKGQMIELDAFANAVGREQQYLDPRNFIRFWLDTERRLYLDVHIEDGRLEIRASEMMAVYPKVTNVVEIAIVNTHGLELVKRRASSHTESDHD